MAEAYKFPDEKETPETPQSAQVESDEIEIDEDFYPISPQIIKNSKLKAVSIILSNSKKYSEYILQAFS